MSPRRTIKFDSADDVIADVRRLRTLQLTRLGNWSLEQACWHLSFALKYFMSPGPHPAIDAPQEARENLKRIIAGGQIPPGISSPDQAVPPDHCGPEAIDEFIATLQRFRNFPGPFAPHRLFGPLSPDEGRKLVMIHSAHHLSFLVPLSQLQPTA
jgi:hypothetical protein